MGGWVLDPKKGDRGQPHRASQIAVTAKKGACEIRSARVLGSPRARRAPRWASTGLMRICRGTGAGLDVGVGG
jgi:hypothetical protein